VHLSSRKGGGRGDLFPDGPGGADLRQRESSPLSKERRCFFHLAPKVGRSLSQNLPSFKLVLVIHRSSRKEWGSEWVFVLMGIWPLIKVHQFALFDWFVWTENLYQNMIFVKFAWK